MTGMNTTQTPTAWSFYVRTGSSEVARGEARRMAKAQRHPNPDHGSILWVEQVQEGLWEVCISTKGRYL